MSNNHIKSVKSIFDSAVYVAINNDYSDLNIKHKSISLATAVAGNGCDIIQYRPHQISYYKMLDEAKAIFQICNQHNIPLIVNNYIDLTLDINADGVHLTGNEISSEHARAILGTDKIIGTCVSSVEQAQEILLDDLDYVTIGNIFSAEPNSPSAKIIGIKELQKMLDIVKTRNPKISIVGVGGVDESNAENVMACGVDSIAVLGTIAYAKKPAITCKKLKKIIVKARMELVSKKA